MINYIIDESYWRTFAIKIARKRGITNSEILADIGQMALVKIYSMNLSNITKQIELERLVGKSIYNMITDWQRNKQNRTVFYQLEDYAIDNTNLMATTANFENVLIDYVDSTTPAKLSFVDGSTVLVDKIDESLLHIHNWHITNVGNKSYIGALQKSADNKSKRTRLYLHRLIVQNAVSTNKFKKSKVVTFIDGNTLNCRRSNLTLDCTPLVNLL